MLHNGYLNAFDPKLESVQDANPTILATIFGTYELPKFSNRSFWLRESIGGWQLNGVMRAENGGLIGAPSNVNIIGPVNQPNPTYNRYINTCYENTAGQLVESTASAPACDNLSPTPAYQQRLSYTLQENSNVIGVRTRVYPLLDASLFKKFALGHGRSFEIRGEFFNVLNTPEFPGPGNGIGSSSFGEVVRQQSNNPRIGALTARLNF